MADRYTNFAALAASERSGVDYRYWLKDRGTAIVVLAPHGGWIEPGTSEIAEAIAHEDYSIYAFEGLRRRPHGALHITSTLFDEPEGLRLVSGAETAIAIHGREDDDDSTTVWLGGRDIALRGAIASSLKSAGFEMVPAPPGMAALNPANICNRGTSRGGVQLELPLTLRNQLIEDTAMLQLFASAVRKAISSNRGQPQ